MNKHPLISLCIPTFNRCKQLESSLNNIREQFKYIDASKIEIIVSDNCSNDCTESICDLFSKTAPCSFLYYKNLRNIGFDGNILSLYSKAIGTYVWFLSDDDLILDGKVKTVVEILENFQPDLCYANVLMNGKPYVQNNSRLDLTPYYPSGCFKDIKTDVVFRFSENLERIILIRLCSFISSCIIKRDASIIPQLNIFCGTGILQDAIMDLTLDLKATAFIPSEAIIVGGEKEYFSYWFMDSVIFGTSKLYRNNSLRFQDKFSFKIAIYTCKFGLVLLADRKNNDVRYPVDFSLFVRILAEYRIYTLLLIAELFYAYFPTLYQLKQSIKKMIKSHLKRA
jgi:glycosyltransferase involved in cell wall biosynthesis